MGISLALHMLSIIIWVGGMFFAYVILRPVAASELEPPLRLKVWCQIFNRFFVWVWIAIVLTPLSGVMLLSPYQGFSQAPPHIHMMTTLGVLMIMIFLFVYLVPFKRFKHCLDQQDIPGAAAQLNRIRILVGTNTLLGVITVITATAGRYYFI